MRVVPGKSYRSGLSALQMPSSIGFESVNLLTPLGSLPMAAQSVLRRGKNSMGPCECQALKQVTEIAP